LLSGYNGLMEILKNPVARHVIEFLEICDSSLLYILTCTQPENQELAEYMVNKFFALGMARFTGKSVFYKHMGKVEPLIELTIKGRWLIYIQDLEKDSTNCIDIII